MAKHLSKHNVGIIANPSVGGHGVGHPEGREGGGRGGGSGSSHVIGWAWARAGRWVSREALKAC